MYLTSITTTDINVQLYIEVYLDGVPPLLFFIKLLGKVL